MRSWCMNHTQSHNYEEFVGNQKYKKLVGDSVGESCPLFLLPAIDPESPTTSKKPYEGLSTHIRRIFVGSQGK